MGLGPGNLAGVDGAVDEVMDTVADEDLLVPGAGPDGVGQHADADAAILQPGQHREGVRVQQGRPFPFLIVRGAGQVVFRQTGRIEDLTEGAAAMLDP